MDLTGLDPTLQPSIALIANSIPLKHTTAVLVCVLCSFLFQAVAQLLATSRYTWALARESALPWSHIVRRLSKANKLPLTAIWLIVAMSAPVLLLLTINTSIISTILLEGAGISVVLTYATPPLLYLFCPKDALVGDGRAQWTLRRWSKPIAAVGCVFALTFMVMLCLPTGWPVNARKFVCHEALQVRKLTPRLRCWWPHSQRIVRGRRRTLHLSRVGHVVGVLWQQSLRWTDQDYDSMDHWRRSGFATLKI